jgi:DNA-binding transcriptional regulator LsrR (DeoR family)
MPIPFNDLATEFRCSAATLKRNVDKAFQEGLVEVLPRGQASGQLDRLPELEELLRKKYAKQLRRVIVVADKMPSRTQATPDRPRVDDTIYAVLGDMMAARIASYEVIRDGDIVGIGSGRAVHYTVKSLTKRDPLVLSNVTLMSLTGSAWSYQEPGQQHGSFYDADAIVGQLVACFDEENQPKQRVISNRLVITTDLETARSSTCLGDENWGRERPTIAVVGVGTVAEGHRLWDLIKHQLDNAIFRSIRDQIARLIALCDEYHTEDYSPVADTSNYLFFVDPAIAGKQIPPDKVGQIHALITEINGTLLNIREHQFQTIPTLALVAGTKRKACAIRALLNNANFNVRILCTDKEAALRLIDLP